MYTPNSQSSGLGGLSAGKNCRSGRSDDDCLVVVCRAATLCVFCKGRHPLFGGKPQMEAISLLGFPI